VLPSRLSSPENAKHWFSPFPENFSSHWPQLEYIHRQNYRRVIAACSRNMTQRSTRGRHGNTFHVTETPPGQTCPRQRLGARLGCTTYLFCLSPSVLCLGRLCFSFCLVPMRLRLSVQGTRRYKKNSALRRDRRSGRYRYYASALN
jgi:hypothetical protein